jgi:6,7-dimethyl-8-ribityllumazine synthase
MTGKPNILIVESRYYGHIADGLLAGARQALEEAGATYEVVTVPGALEIPQVIAIAHHHDMFKLTAGRCLLHGAVALGCVIRGETTHYDIVAGESARALMQLSTLHGIAIGNGILTVENEEQAKTRADPHGKNKGGEAARACLEVIRARDQFFARRITQ